MKAKFAQSFLTLCNPKDYTVNGILQVRILEWAAFPFSRGSSQSRDQIQGSNPAHIAGRFFTSWVTREAQEYWSGWPIPSPADLPDRGIELGSPALQVDSFPTELSGKHESESRSVMSNSLRPHGLYSPWNSPGHNTGVDSCSLLQGIFPTQGWNPGLLHCRQILYQLSHHEALNETINESSMVN